MDQNALVNQVGLPLKFFVHNMATPTTQAHSMHDQPIKIQQGPGEKKKGVL